MDVSQIEFKIVQEKIADDLLPGEAIVTDIGGGKNGLILCCPNCGKASGGSHVYNKETKTLSPSIVHDGCGWHGHLTNGKFSNA